VATSGQQPPSRIFDQRPAATSAPLGGTLGVLAIAFGIGVLGAYALDLHSHACDSCGYKWRHLGAFNLGDLPAHTCRKCGTVQWWKRGWQHAVGMRSTDGAFRPLSSTPSMTAPRPFALSLEASALKKVV
jgi:hypothetical protein